MAPYGLCLLIITSVLGMMCVRLLLLVIDRLSTDIEWSVEIHIISDDQSGSGAHRFIIIIDNCIWTKVGDT